MKTCINCKHRTWRRSSDPTPEVCKTCVAREYDRKNGEILFEPSGWEAAEEKVAEVTGDKRVDHPAHYNQGKYECIDVMEDVFGEQAVKHFCLLNAFKYIWRANEKNGIEDVKKAKWYLEKMIEMEGGR